MGKTGAIIAIIAGVLGTLAAFFTLFVGGVGSAFSASDAGKVLTLGWGGVTFSFLAIVYGGIALSRPRVAGVGLILSSLGGIVVGGTLVAIFMVLALVGGIMAAWSKPAIGQQQDGPSWRGMLAAAVVPLGFAAFFVSQLLGADATTVQTAAPSATKPVTTLPVGATAKGEQFEVTVHRFELLSRLDTRFSHREAEPGSVFAVLQVGARCIDRESRYYHAGALFGTLAGQEVKFDKEESFLGVDSAAKQLNPMMESRGAVIFKIPSAAAQAPLTWHPGRGFGEVRFLLNPPQAAETAQAQASGSLKRDTPAADLSGLYTGPNGSGLSLVRQGGGYRFELTALSPRDADGSINTGEATGDLRFDGNVATFHDGECTLRFTFDDQGIRIEQEGVCDFGLNVSAAGRYLRRPPGQQPAAS